MAIKILLKSWTIQGKEDNLIEQDLITIFEANGDKVIKSSLESQRDDKYFKLELENRQNEQEIVNTIINQKIKLYGFDIRATVYYEIIIRNIPNDLNKENLQEELEKMVKFKSNNFSARIGKGKCAFMTVNSLDEANDLITNLNNQVLRGKPIKVEFAELKQNQKRERTSLVSEETVQQKTVETDLTSLGAFYKERDYDIVTKKLKEFVYGVCIYLSTLPPQQNFTQIEQKQNESDL